MLQFPKHGNKENLERNSRLRITRGPVFTRHLNATTTMAVRSVTSSPGASLERRFKGRGTWDVGRGARDEEKRAARNNHCSLTLFLTLTLRKEGRGARNETEGKVRTTRNNHCSLTLFLTLRKEGRETRDVTEEKLRGARDETEGKVRTARNNHCSLTLFLTLTLLKEGRGTWDETEEKLRGARKNHCSLTLFLTLTLLKELRGTRRKERGTNSYSLFTVHYKGIFPCFFLGNFTALVSSIRKALISFERVWSGRITSST